MSIDERLFQAGDLVEYIPEAFNSYKDKYIGSGYVESVEYNFAMDSYFYTVITFNTIKQSAKNFAEYHLGEYKRLWSEHDAAAILRKIS